MAAARMSRGVVAASVVSVGFTLTHAIEDFAYNVHEERFGVPLLPAALSVAAVYGVQVLAAALSARDDRRGHWMNAALGFGWVLAAALDHLGEVLFAWPYRQGLVSKALEVGIMVSGAVWGWLGVMAARQGAR